MINWKKPLEAYHTDGRVVPVELEDSANLGNDNPDAGGDYYTKINQHVESISPNHRGIWRPDGTGWGTWADSGWRIRNREPEVFIAIDELIEYPILCTMNLSGEEIKVGTAESARDPYCIWFKTTENAEEVFMSTTEARLLIAALNHAIETVES